MLQFKYFKPYDPADNIIESLMLNCHIEINSKLNVVSTNRKTWFSLDVIKNKQWRLNLFFNVKVYIYILITSGTELLINPIGPRKHWTPDRHIGSVKAAWNTLHMQSNPQTQLDLILWLYYFITVVHDIALNLLTKKISCLDLNYFR